MQYMVIFVDGIGPRSCDWSPPNGWEMWSYEGIKWFLDEDLTEIGRLRILRHFGLQSIAFEFPLEILRHTSPAMLILRRCALEVTDGLPSLSPISD